MLINVMLVKKKVYRVSGKYPSYGITSDRIIYAMKFKNSQKANKTT